MAYVKPIDYQAMYNVFNGLFYVDKNDILRHRYDHGKAYKDAEVSPKCHCVHMNGRNYKKTRIIATLKKETVIPNVHLGHRKYDGVGEKKKRQSAGGNGLIDYQAMFNVFNGLFYVDKNDILRHLYDRGRARKGAEVAPNSITITINHRGYIRGYKKTKIISLLKNHMISNV